MAFRAVTVGALAATLLVTALAVPASAQINPSPKPIWPDGAQKTLYVHVLDQPACIPSDGFGSEWGPYFMNGAQEEPCAKNGEQATYSNILNGATYRVGLMPKPVEPIPLVAGAKINVTLWVGYSGPGGTATPNDINVQVRLRQGTSTSASPWTGTFDPAEFVAAAQWYKVEVQLDPPGGPQILNGTEPWYLEADQQECLQGTAVNSTCVAASPPGVSSVGHQWKLGTQGDHASTIELPIPSAFVSGKPWPPIDCAANEVVNLTTKQCDKVVVECPDDEALNETSGLCEAIEVEAPGPEGPSGNLPGGDNVTTQGNNTTNETKDKGLPSVGTVGLLAATLVAFVAAGRRRREE